MPKARLLASPVTPDGPRPARGRSPAWLVAVLAGLSALLPAAPASAEPMTLVSRQFELSGRLLASRVVDFDGDGAKDIVAAHLEKDGELNARGRMRRRLSVFLQRAGKPANQRWKTTPDLTIEVDDEAVLFSVADFLPAPGAEIALVRFAGVTLLSRSGKALKPDVTTVIKTEKPGFFDFPAEGGLFYWDLCPDLDGDKRCELLFPTKSGYLVLGAADAATASDETGRPTLSSRGLVTVSSSEKFGPPMETEFLNRFLTYQSTLRRVVALDMNADGRKDLVVYRSKGLSTFLQGKDGRFRAKADRNRKLKLVEDAADNKGGEKKDAFARVALALRDLNGDRRVDLVATQTLGKIGVFSSLRTRVLIFLGTPKGIDESKPNRIINLEGLTVFPEFTDFNGDKDVDIVLSSLRVDLLSNVKKAITKSLSTTYTVYLYRGGPRVYSQDADFERDVEVDLDSAENQGKVRLTFFRGDYNGDGLKDMLTVASRSRLKIVPGGIESSFFSGDSLVLKDDDEAELAVPTSPSLDVLDIDGDGADEILLTYPKPDDPNRRFLRIIEKS